MCWKAVETCSSVIFHSLASFLTSSTVNHKSEANWSQIGTQASTKSLNVSVVSFHSLLISHRISDKSSILVQVHADISPSCCIVGIMSSTAVHIFNNSAAVSLTLLTSNQLSEEKAFKSSNRFFVISEFHVNLSNSSATFL